LAGKRTLEDLDHLLEATLVLRRDVGGDGVAKAQGGDRGLLDSGELPAVGVVLHVGEGLDRKLVAGRPSRDASRSC